MLIGRHVSPPKNTGVCSLHWCVRSSRCACVAFTLHRDAPCTLARSCGRQFAEFVGRRGDPQQRCPCHTRAKVSRPCGQPSSTLDDVVMHGSLLGFAGMSAPKWRAVGSNWRSGIMLDQTTHEKRPLALNFITVLMLFDHVFRTTASTVASVQFGFVLGWESSAPETLLKTVTCKFDTQHVSSVANCMLQNTSAGIKNHSATSAAHVAVRELCQGHVRSRAFSCAVVMLDEYELSVCSMFAISRQSLCQLRSCVTVRQGWRCFAGLSLHIDGDQLG